MAKSTLRTCSRGHQYFKSSDCPVCPECEKLNTKKNFLDSLSAPARRALQNEGIDSLKKLSSFSEKELLALHGLGPSSIPLLKKLLNIEGFDFRK